MHILKKIQKKIDSFQTSIFLNINNARNYLKISQFNVKHFNAQISNC